MDFKKMCMEVKSRYYQQYVKNPQLRTSAFYPLHPQILSAKIIRILPVSTSARPQVRTSAFYYWPIMYMIQIALLNVQPTTCEG